MLAQFFEPQGSRRSIQGGTTCLIQTNRGFGIALESLESFPIQRHVSNKHGRPRPKLVKEDSFWPGGLSCIRSHTWLCGAKHASKHPLEREAATATNTYPS